MMMMLFAGIETGVHCEIGAISLQSILANAMYGWQRNRRVVELASVTPCRMCGAAVASGS